MRDYDLDDDDALSRVAPVYRASEAISSKRLRELVQRALPLLRHVPDPMPSELRARLGLPLKPDALAVLHQPESTAQAESGRHRLAFEELLVLQVGLARRRAAAGGGAPAVPLGQAGELIDRYRARCRSRSRQRRSGSRRHRPRPCARRPMERLLQGDVGSGKTVVALHALLRAVERGHQAALMAPTETLAEQHFLTVEPICLQLGVRCVLVTSSIPGKQHAAALRALATGEADLAVGTHALIQEAVEFRSLGLAVVDEQHRFGVEQRAALRGERATRAPRLVMTATPIPRTLALTVYGDLDVSESTSCRRAASRSSRAGSATSARREAYTRLRRRALADGRQAYVVCPLVEESETIEAKAAATRGRAPARRELAGLRASGCCTVG